MAGAAHAGSSPYPTQPHITSCVLERMNPSMSHASDETACCMASRPCCCSGLWRGPCQADITTTHLESTSRTLQVGLASSRDLSVPVQRNIFFWQQPDVTRKPSLQQPAQRHCGSCTHERISPMLLEAATDARPRRSSATIQQRRTRRQRNTHSCPFA